MSYRVPKKAIQYIFFEMIPSFLMGILVFIFIMLMFQALRYTEFVLIHGGDLKTIGQIIMFLAISFIPALFPMSLLFAVLMTYGRLSGDSEIIAFKASGVGPLSLLSPALIFGLMVSIFSAHTMFSVAPWGNRQFELLISQQSQQKAGLTLREGTFAEGFFDLVIYANKVNSEKGLIEKVFIYDERQPDSPLTIIAKSGELLQDNTRSGQSARLLLNSGEIHRKAENHTQIKFDNFELKLLDPVNIETREKSPQSLNYSEILQNLANEKLDKDKRVRILTEWHKRWAISSACLIFALLGVGIGTVQNKRSQRSSGLIPSIIVIVLYWVLYITAEGLARGGQVPVAIAIWLPNFLFLSFSLFKLKTLWS